MNADTEEKKDPPTIVSSRMQMQIIENSDNYVDTEVSERSRLQKKQVSSERERKEQLDQRFANNEDLLSPNMGNSSNMPYTGTS